MAEPIVLLPDMLCDARLFGPQLAELSAEHSLTVMPIGGSGRMSDLADAVLAQAPQRFALAGCGMGGVVAMEIASRAPERLSRLALISTSPLQESPFDAMAYEPMLVAARAGRLAEVVSELFAVTDEDLDGQLLPLLQDMADNIGVERFVNQVRAAQRHRDMQSVLRKCVCPVQVICGEEDRLIPVKRHQVMTDFLTDGELSIIPSAGHVPCLQNPSAVTQALRHWMTRPLMLR
ncbi:alpha/beta fold hydrolase [Cognatishimia activa]|uniref:Pimelyl-[acyl-carrier protein] methyl ester esterase n=1 Tax=Cognatishimia activa TaxID=1715691 RepID=A0A0N7MC91_9RHOB|nr:alpha/beta hydrolase [Cognatishimia activa]CUJ11724.1 Pimelyl-[acyl-carrier protein] methyl ester esterase [Cognatishimia activa]CUK27552.1 Pimelyl-[acyl-carrier protein] methyl ester esterase [Cognatishimia activa]